MTEYSKFTEKDLIEAHEASDVSAINGIVSLVNILRKRGLLTDADGPSFALAERDYGTEAWDEPDEDRQVQPDDMLAQFVEFLRAASPEQFEQSIVASASGNSSGSMWSRLLGVGAGRVADVGSLLWPYATHLELLRHADTMRDAVRLVVAAYPDMGQAKRAIFETQALDFDCFDDDYERKQWRRVLGRILKLLSPDDFVTDAMRAFRAELEEAGQLEENDPVDRMSVSWGEHGGYYREMLEREGVDLDKGPEAGVLEASDCLHELVQQTPSTSAATALAALWADAMPSSLCWAVREAATGPDMSRSLGPDFSADPKALPAGTVRRLGAASHRGGTCPAPW